MRGTSSRGVVALVVSLIAIGACGSEQGASSRFVSSSEDGGTESSGVSFDPLRYSSACETDADCMLIGAIKNCSTCCSFQAIQKAQQPIDDAKAVEDECSRKSSLGVGRCLMACGVLEAKCVGKSCTVCGSRGIKCESGINVGVALSNPGRYTIDITIDGVARPTCEFDLPSFSNGKCDLAPTITGPPDTITNLFIPRSAEAASVTIAIKRNEFFLGTKTFIPTFEDGPTDFPNCPATCRVANATFP